MVCAVVIRFGPKSFLETRSKLLKMRTLYIFPLCIQRYLFLLNVLNRDGQMDGNVAILKVVADPLTLILTPFCFS